MNHILQHLINNGRLVDSTRLHAADESIDFGILLLFLIVEILHLLVDVHAFVSIVSKLLFLYLLTLGLEKPLRCGHNLLQLSLSRLLLSILFLEISSLVNSGLQLALHPLDISLRLDRELS